MDAANNDSNFEQSAQRGQRSCVQAGLFSILLATGLGGCVSPGLQDKAASPAVTQDALEFEPVPVPAAPISSAPSAITSPDQPPSNSQIWSRLIRGFRLEAIEHPRIDHEISRLQRSPSAFFSLMTRAEPYLHHILNEIESAGLPTELALLPAVESGFRPHVYSPDGAAGLWQFMPATGRMFGLRQDWWYDKRRSVRASTQAAIGYLDRLNQRFDGDWLHSLAAYNAGARKVRVALRRAQRRGEPRDFWSLDLPGETDRYVPRLLAIAAVVSDPGRYGLRLPEIPDQAYFAPALTAGQIDLAIAAELAGIPLDQLLRLNAGHRRWSSHPEGPHELLLPIAQIPRFETAAASLPDDQRLRWQRHRIKAGESLSRIARRFGVTVEAIQQSNGLKGSHIRAGDNLLIPLSASVTRQSARSNTIARQRVHYRVRSGDSLHTIARRFQVSVADLKRWNRVGRYIHPGERLTVFIDPDADTQWAAW